MSEEIELHADACEGCALRTSRRDFLRNGFAAAFGALLLVGAAESAAAKSIRWTTGARSGSTVAYAIPAQNGAEIDRANEVILVRWGSNVYAFALSCPHKRTALRWEPENARFQCPKHHSKYQPDGTFISGRATRNMDRLSIQREGNGIVVDVTAKHKSTEDPAGWKSAVVVLGDS